MSKDRILVTESLGFSSRAAAMLRELGEVTLADLERDQLLDAVGDAEVLFIRLRNRIDREVLDRAPHVHTIVTTTTGWNHIDVKLLEERGIRLLSLRGETEFLRNVRATAEHTIGLMLTLLRNLRPAMSDVTDGNWNRDPFRGGELYERKIGLIGFGRIGQLVDRYLEAFGAEVKVFDVAHMGVSTPLEELLGWAEIVSLHINWSPENQGFFSRSHFERMGHGAMFINTARGELVDESALVEALAGGRLGGAALDVLDGEPNIDGAANPLIAYARSHDNLLITPHIGGCTAESMIKTEILMAERLSEALRGKASERLIHV